MMRIKRIFAFMMSVLILSGMCSACNDHHVGGETTSVGADMLTTEEAETESEATDEPVYQLTEPVMIDFWYGNKANSEFWEAMIAEFNTQSERTLVTVVGKAVGTLAECKAELNRARREGTELPAVVTLSYDVLFKLSDDGVLSDITDLMNANGFDFGTLVDGAVDQVTVDDAIVGMPWDCETSVYYYNRTELEEYGLDSSPTTWEEFKHWAKEVFDATGVPAVDFYSQDSDMLYQMLLNFGGDIREKEDPTKTAFDEENVEVRLKELIELVNAGYIRWQRNRSAEEIAATWMNGETMSCLLPTGYYPEYLSVMEKKPEELRFEIGLAWSWGDVNQYGLVEGSALCVAEAVSQEEKAGAGVFLNWLNSPENHVRWAEYTNSCLIHKENIDNQELLDTLCAKLPELKANVYPYLKEYYIKKPLDDVYEDVMSTMVKALRQVLYQEKEFEVELMTAISKIEGYLTAE